MNRSPLILMLMLNATAVQAKLPSELEGIQGSGPMAEASCVEPMSSKKFRSILKDLSEKAAMLSNSQKSVASDQINHLIQNADALNLDPATLETYRLVELSLRENSLQLLRNLHPASCLETSPERIVAAEAATKIVKMYGQQ